MPVAYAVQPRQPFVLHDVVGFSPSASSRATHTTVYCTDTPWSSLLFSVARAALTFAGGSVRSCLVGSSSWGVLTRVPESPLSRGLGLGRGSALWREAKLNKHTLSARRGTLTDLLGENYLTKTNRISERACHAKRSGRVRCGSCLTARSASVCLSCVAISGLCHTSICDSGSRSSRFAGEEELDCRSPSPSRWLSRAVERVRHPGSSTLWEM